MPKQVKWVDNKKDGIMDQDVLEVSEAASSTKEIVDLEVSELRRQGFTYIEAHTIAGKSISIYDEEIYKNPSFYDSIEKIMKNKADRDLINEQSKARRAKYLSGINVSDNSDFSINPFTFFSSTRAILTISAIAATTALVVKACR